MSDKAEAEVWKQYPDYDFIEVSNLGRIRTKDRIVTYKDGRKRFIKGKVLKQQLNPNGYMYVELRVNGKRINLKVSRMVAVTFVPNPSKYPEVNHIDCDPTNNRADNLEWCTHQENIAYRDKLGHIAKHNAPKKPVIAVNLDTFEVFWFESQNEAARHLGVSTGNIQNVLKGRYNKTGGYWFTYADKNAIGKTIEKFSNEIAFKVEELMLQNQI